MKRTVKTTLMVLFAGLLFQSCKKDKPIEPVIQLPAIELPCDTFHESTILVNYPNRPVDYIVDCQASVHGDLIIEPGVVIEFTTDAGLAVYEQGSIQADGAASDSLNITFTGVDKIPGAWAGILIDSDDPKNSISHSKILYAGGDQFNSNGDLGAIILWADARLSLSNTLIQSSKSIGLNISYQGVQLEDFNNNQLTQCDVPMRIEMDATNAMRSSNDFSGNASDFIEVLAGTAKSEIIWPALNVPYRGIADDGGNTRHLGIGGDSKWTIDPGTTIEMSSDMQIYIADGSAISAVGTVTEPIVIRGTAAIAGAWQGFNFDFTQHVENQLTYCVIEDAGSTAAGGAIYMWAKPQLSVTNCTFRNLQTCAFYHAPSSSNPNTNLSESNNTYEAIGGNTHCP